jgi:hypothetical protein
MGKNHKKALVPKLVFNHLYYEEGTIIKNSFFLYGM